MFQGLAIDFAQRFGVQRNFLGQAFKTIEAFLAQILNAAVLPYRSEFASLRHALAPVGLHVGTIEPG